MHPTIVMTCSGKGACKPGNVFNNSDRPHGEPTDAPPLVLVDPGLQYIDFASIRQQDPVDREDPQGRKHRHESR